MTQATKDKHRVTLFKSPMLEYPELWMSIYVQGPDWEHPAFAKMFTKGKCARATSIDDADLVVFTGGDDVNPALYGENPHPTTVWDDDRDTEDMKVYLECYEKGIPMFGVCRGAQFGWVMNGGKLYQHVDGHNTAHGLYDLLNKRALARGNVSSVHHQMVRPTAGIGAMIIANTYSSTFKWLNDKEKQEDKSDPDIEAFFIQESGFFGVQGHPEYHGYDTYTRWCLEWIQELFQLGDTTELRPTESAKGGKRIRLKRDLMDLRKDNRIYQLREAA